MEETVAVVVKLDTFNAVMNFLSTQPFNQVAGLINGMGESPGVTQTEISRMKVDEAPE